jgi:tetratricopeptide (TPR) repeat protein
MIHARFAFAALAFLWRPVNAQALGDGAFKLALSAHPGQLSWSATGFKIVQTSAKPDGREIGIRGSSASGGLTFLGFLFLFPEQAPLTSSKCREQVVGPATKANPRLRILKTAETSPTKGLPISSVSSLAPGQDGATVYSVRAFIATGDICGDLEVYGKKPISMGDPEIKEVFSSYQFDEKYEPTFKDIVFYGEVLYRAQMYKAAAPILESALSKLKKDGSGELPSKTWKRVATDEAGMAYGMSGDVAKARAIFERAIEEDPDYPLYYYNLACADAEEKKLTDARRHLQQAFARKANLLSSETMPDPTKDDSFLPYRTDKAFWAFLEALEAGK